MLLQYKVIKCQPELFQTFTSLKPAEFDAEFDALLPHFTTAWRAYHATRVRPAEQRQRQVGGGRKVTTLPTVADKLFFI